MFGPRLVRDYGQSAPDTWRNVIGAMHSYELQRGLKNLLESGSGSVPTLPQFIKACRTPIESEQSPAPVSHRVERKFDPIEAHANKCLIAYMWNKRRHFWNDEQLHAVLAIKNKISDQYTEILMDDATVTGGQIRDTLFAAWQRFEEAI